MDVLSLQANSFCHVFNQGEWQNHQMETCWKVQPGQHLLYRAFRLQLHDCLNIDDEIQWQPYSQISATNRLKHQGTPTTLTNASKFKKNLYSSEVYSAQSSCVSTPGTTRPPSPSLSSPSLPPLDMQAILAFTENLHDATPVSSYMPTSQMDSVASTDGSETGVWHPVLGLMKWPHEFYFVDIVNGLKSYDNKQKQGQRQQQAFQEVFSVQCVCQTLSNKCHLLKRICRDHVALFDLYMSKGHVEDARWAYFESHVQSKNVWGQGWLDILANAGSKRNRYVILSYTVSSVQWSALDSVLEIEDKDSQDEESDEGESDSDSCLDSKGTVSLLGTLLQRSWDPQDAVQYAVSPFKEHHHFTCIIFWKYMIGMRKVVHLMHIGRKNMQSYCALCISSNAMNTLTLERSQAGQRHWMSNGLRRRLGNPQSTAICLSPMRWQASNILIW